MKTKTALILMFAAGYALGHLDGYQRGHAWGEYHGTVDGFRRSFEATRPALESAGAELAQARKRKWWQ